MTFTSKDGGQSSILFFSLDLDNHDLQISPITKILKKIVNVCHLKNVHRIFD